MATAQWKNELVNEWQRQQKVSAASPFKYPLNQQTFDHEEIIAMVEVMLTGKLTMGEQVKKFEAEFARVVKSPYAVMVNSGSSANLLAVAVACAPRRSKHWKVGDEVLVPAVCWSTSVFPLLQHGLVPVFVDVDPLTLNVTAADLRKHITPKTKGLMAVHVMGNCADMKEIMDLATEQDWIVVEDTCEALGTTCDGKYMGTIGDFGTYSFYFSHHMTTGEGGVVTCRTKEDMDLLKSMRAHGWTREMEPALKQKWESESPDIDGRFLFINQGYNLRPMECQAAMGLVQLHKLHRQNECRKVNYERLVELIQKHPKYRGQFDFIRNKNPGRIEAIWFGFPCLLTADFAHRRADFLKYLTEKSVENRPVLTGNFMRQPCLKIVDGVTFGKPEEFPGADQVHHRGFFFGVNALVQGEQAELEQLADILCEFFA
jgi:CDP-6-deoxy-D-xylo-4-hexulose-3-dehydrase